MGSSVADQTYRQVMTVEPSPARSPFEAATYEFVFGEVWPRPGLSRRDRRWVTLTCVGGADAPGPIDAHVYAALNSGDVSLDELLEFVLHFAVYCGWPKASHVEMVAAMQWARMHEERGKEVPPWPTLTTDGLAPHDPDARIAGGVQEFVDVNLLPAPPPDSPYRQAILQFVFGHMWQRPGLTRRERRIITVACVAIDDAPVPLMTHVTSALHSGDLTKAEMDEIVLHFSAYSGFAKGQALSDVAEQAWDTRPDSLR